MEEPSRENAPPTVFRSQLIQALRNYGGFVLGACTVPLTFAYFQPIFNWVEQLPNGSGHYPPDWWWAPVMVSSVISNFVSTLFLYGPCLLLGGLLGRHSIRAGLLVSVAVVTVVTLVLHSLHGGPQFEDHWLHYITFPLSYLSLYLGAVVPYLLGFSLRRLLVLSVMCQPVK